MSIFLVGLMLSGCTVVVQPQPDPKPGLYGDVVGWVSISVPSVGGRSTSAEELFHDELIVTTSNYYPERGYEALERARVTISDPKQGARTTYTAKDGKFYFTNVSAGWRTLTIDHKELRNPMEKEIYIKADQRIQLEPAARGGIGYYLIIGIGDYYYGHYMPDANSTAAENDADDMFDLLKNGNSMKGVYRKLTNAGATKAAIKKVIDEINAMANPEDYLVFYFSGYADTEIWKGGGDLKPLDHLVPYDGRNFGSNPDDTVITDKELEQWFRGFPGEDVTVILESSYSGTFIDGKVRGYSMDVELLALKKAGYTVLTSSGPDEPHSYEEEKNSGFTKFLLQGLNYMHADTNHDNMVTAKELFNYVDNEMYYKNFPHAPVMHGDPDTVILRR